MSRVRQKSVVTREGWYYLFILGFVVLGSLLRNIQLMVGLSTILATAMIINWRWSKASLRGLIVRRLPVDSLWAGQRASFCCEIENPRARLSTFSLMVTQRFRSKKVAGAAPAKEPWYQRLLSSLFGPSLQHFNLLDAVHPGQRTVAELPVVFSQRGEYESGGLGLSTHFPLGLVRRQWNDGQESELFVGPAIGALSQNWVEQMLGLGWQDSRSGQTARSGEDFFSLRRFTSGDSQRWIHWRASARHNALLVRQFQRSQSKAFWLVVDLWAVEGSTHESLADCEKILRVLATISAAVRAGHLDSVRLTLVTETETTVEFPAGDAEWIRWHRELATAQPHLGVAPLGSMWRRITADAATKSSDRSCPIVFLSPLGIDQYVSRLKDEEARGNPQMLADFWQAQPSIRSWLTPGDNWLSSWYLEPNQASDEDNVTGELASPTGGGRSANRLANAPPVTPQRPLEKVRP
jgi:uncharacterized protein (DUF58 family)